MNKQITDELKQYLDESHKIHGLQVYVGQPAAVCWMNDELAEKGLNRFPSIDHTRMYIVFVPDFGPVVSADNSELYKRLSRMAVVS
jgi:hypothetical protein